MKHNHEERMNLPLASRMGANLVVSEDHKVRQPETCPPLFKEPTISGLRLFLGMTMLNFHNHAKLVEESLDKCPEGLLNQTEQIVDEEKTLLLLRAVEGVETWLETNQEWAKSCLPDNQTK